MADIPIRHPLLELTLARLREFWRDPGALFWTFGFPAILAIALGLAFRASPIPSERVALVCETDCDRWQQLITERAGLIVEQRPREQALDRLRAGRVDLVWSVSGPRNELHFDPSRPEARSGRLALELALEEPDTPPAFTAVPHTEPGGRYIDFLVPSLVGLNVMSSALWGVGFAVVEARKRKLLKQLAATPMRRSHFLLSYMFSRLLFLIGEVVFLFGFGWLVFEVPIHGNPMTLLLLSVLGSLCFTGIGLLIASRPASIEVASGWANFVMLPMWVLSGVFFSYERFPEALHPIIRALPLTALNDSLRAVSNEGASLLSCGLEVTVLGVWAMLAFVAALKFFRWQ